MFRLKSFDWSFLIIPLILSIISLATIYTITYVTVGDKLTLSQSIYVIIGFILLIIFSLLDYHHFRTLSLPLFLVGIFLLVPLLPFFSQKIPFVICEFNACRWLNLGFFRFQSS